LIVAPYPVATLVQLSNGEIALVKEIRSTALDRPVVRVIKDQVGRYYDQLEEIDLSTRPDLSASRHISWYGHAAPYGDPTPVANHQKLPPVEVKLRGKVDDSPLKTPAAGPRS
jgi:hypothetical protein